MNRCFTWLILFFALSIISVGIVHGQPLVEPMRSVFNEGKLYCVRTNKGLTSSLSIIDLNEMQHTHVFSYPSVHVRWQVRSGQFWPVMNDYILDRIELLPLAS